MNIRQETLDQLLDLEMRRLDVPGVAVGILSDGRIEAHSRGVISLETGYPTHPETMFQIGSITKLFTATLVMSLVDQGKLNLDTPVRTYLPTLRLADERAQETLTLQHLLTHTGGFDGDQFINSQDAGEDALACYINQSHTWEQLAAPGTLWSYCNSGFGIAGRVAEVITGTSYETAVREHLFEPLGLDRSFFFAHEAIVYSVVAGHSHAQDQGPPNVAHPWWGGRYANPAGGILSTVTDLLAFTRFHLGDRPADGHRLPGAQTVRRMQEPQAQISRMQEWGIGWSLQTINGVPTISHGGGMNGQIARLLAIPGEGFGLAVLTNSDRGGKLADAVEEWALESYCGLKAEDPSPVDMPPEQLEPLAGRYRRPLADLTVSLEGRSLTLTMTQTNPFSGEVTRHPPAKLEPLPGDEFTIAGGDKAGARVQFIDGDRPRFVRVGGRLVPRIPDGEMLEAES